MRKQKKIKLSILGIYIFIIFTSIMLLSVNGFALTSGLSNQFAGYQKSENENSDVAELIAACERLIANSDNKIVEMDKADDVYSFKGDNSAFVPTTAKEVDISRWHIIEYHPVGTEDPTIYGVYSDYIGKVRSAATSGKVDNMVSDIQISANTTGAQTLLSGLEGIIALVVGILAYVVVIALPVFTALDVCYITMPLFREKSESVKNRGDTFGNVMTKTRKNGSQGLRFITDEAQYAVESASLAEGKSALKTYLFKRMGSFVMLAIVLYILIGGQVNVIVKLAINLVSGVMGALGGLGG